MPDKPNDFDQQKSRMQRLTRNKTFRLLFYVVFLVNAAFQVMMFLRQRRQHLVVFHSTFEMVQVIALVAVLLVGVLVKSRQNRRG